MATKYLDLVDSFVPSSATSTEAIERYRAAVSLTAIGVFFSSISAALYAWAGSPIAGLAVSGIPVGLFAALFAIRRGYSLSRIGNAMMATTFVATLIVAARSGGLSSPAQVWTFLLPLSAYPVSGRRSALLWSVLAVIQLSGFYLVDAWGIRFPNDFRADVLSVLRISGYLGFFAALVILVMVVDNVRQTAANERDQANRQLERERLVADLHDGIGSQLGVLIALAGKGRLAHDELASDLTACLDDLRLIVDSLDYESRPIDVALADLRGPLQRRCEALGVELVWSVGLRRRESWPASAVLHVLRSSQELVSNALRHAQPKRVTVTVTDVSQRPDWIELVVADDGGSKSSTPQGTSGRGHHNLEARAERLGGHFRRVETPQGSRAVLEFPRPRAELRTG